MNHRIAATRGINHVLDALSAEENPPLGRSLNPVFFPAGAVILEAGQVIEAVYFPLNAVVSLLTVLGDGTTVEVASVGSDGIVGAPLVPNARAALRAVAQMAGWAMRLDAVRFLDELDRHRPLRTTVDDHLVTLVGQIAQSAACNGRHSNEQRLSRWILLSHDRAGRDVIDISRQFLGHLVGCSPRAVSLSLGILAAGGLVSYHDGQLTVVDRAGLETLSCECYGVQRHDLDRVADQGLDDSDLAGGHVLSGRARAARRKVSAGGAQ